MAPNNPVHRRPSPASVYRDVVGYMFGQPKEEGDQPTYRDYCTLASRLAWFYDRLLWGTSTRTEVLQACIGPPAPMQPAHSLAS